MQRRGHKPYVVSLDRPGAVTGRLRLAGIPTYDCQATGTTDWRVFFRLARLIRSIRPDIVHALLFHANVAARVAMPLAGRSYRRLICEIQTVEIERPWHLTVGGMTHRLGHCVVGNSPSVVRHLRCRAFMARSRLRCIPGGVDAQAIRSAPRTDPPELGLIPGVPLVLWVGRLDPVKGLDELLAAFARVADGTAAQLALAGDGAYAESVRRNIRERRLGDRVHMLGSRDDVAGLLKLADVFVLPSRTEGMPNALLEAMAAGRPIVTSDVPGCRDLIDHERTGLLVRSGDEAALGDAITRLLTDRRLAEKLGHAASRQVDSRYTLAHCVERYEALYREVGFRVS